MAKAHAPGSFCWVELASRDIARARVFYSALLGWTASEAPMPGDQPGTYTMFRLDGRKVAGGHGLQGEEAELPSHWACYVASADLDADLAKLAAAGGRALVPPLDIPGVGRMSVVAGPEGAALGLYQAAEHLGFETEGEVGAHCWSELHTGDAEASSRFYTAALGWTVKSDEGEDMPYYEFASSGRFVAGMLEIQPEWGPIPAHWAVYFRVADLDASLERARELGARVRMPPKLVPEVGRFANLADPTGASFLLIEMSR